MVVSLPSSSFGTPTAAVLFSLVYTMNSPCSASVALSVCESKMGE